MRFEELLFDQSQLDAIFEKYGIRDVAVFGSFGRGDATDKSDVDFLVTFPPNTTLFDVSQLHQELVELLGRNVDLVSRRCLSTRLARRIANDVRDVHAAS